MATQTIDQIPQSNIIGGRFTHNHLPQQELEKKETIQAILAKLYELISVNKTGILLWKGTMGAGKTGVTKTVASNIAENFPDKKVVIYRLDDDRAAPGEIYDRNSTNLSPKVDIRLIEFRGIQSIIDAILNSELKSNSLLFLSEGQFFGNKEQLQYLADLAKERGIILCFDCLSTWFTGIPIEETEFIAKNLAGIANTKSLEACDTFTDGRANVPMRFTPLLPSGNYWQPEKDLDTALYMNEISADKRLSLIQLIENSNDPSIQNLKRYDPKTQQFIYLIPSHPTKDAGFVPGGNERYLPTCIPTVINICVQLGLSELVQEYTDIYEMYYVNPQNADVEM